MALGIDLGFVALELAALVAPADKRAAVVRLSTARANGAGLPNRRKRGKLANDPAAIW
jgi:hypothetical protein